MNESAVEFFHENAGWGYNPATETPEEGRMRGARLLAEAEAWAREVGLRFDWRDDWDVDHVAEFDCYEDEGPTTCESAAAWLGRTVVAALGCIDDATDEYRRVIEAELALEARETVATWYVQAYEVGVRRAVSA